MSTSITDLEKAFYGGYLNLSEADMVARTVDQLRTSYMSAGPAGLVKNNVWTGTNKFGQVGFNNNVPVGKAAAIAAPANAGALYVQATAQSAVDAINAIRVALANIGITA